MRLDLSSVLISSHANKINIGTITLDLSYYNSPAERVSRKSLPVLQDVKATCAFYSGRNCYSHWNGTVLYSNKNCSCARCMTRLLAQPSYDVSGNDFTVTGIAKVGVTVHLIVKIADLSFSDSNE